MNYSTDKNKDFPQFRKKFDSSSVYKIYNNQNMEEVQFIGAKKFKFMINAAKYFELLKIQEILECQNEQYFIISSLEYDKLVNS